MSKTKALFGRQHGWLTSLLLVCSACTGVSSLPDGYNGPTAADGTPNGGDVPGPGGTPSNGSAGATSLPPVPGDSARGGTKVVPSTTLDAGRVVLRRLNRTEFDNTVHDLLGTMSTPAQDTFAKDDISDGFDTIGRTLIMSSLLVEQLDAAAGSLVDELLARPAGDAWRLRVLSCEPSAANAATCLPQILSAFMKNAYRRPVTAEEVQARVALATAVQTSSGDVMRGLNAALKAVLMSPHFLYRVELGDPVSAAATPLNDYELASRLSYFLWASMPDATLLQAAADKKLTPIAADLSAQVDRMLADPKSQGFIDSFAGQWLSGRDALSFVADPKVFAGYDDALRLAMPQETSLFFKALIAEKQPLSALLLGKFSFVNDRLAKQYGLPGGQTAFTRVSLEGTERMGILTQNTFLTVTSYPFRTSPVKRADWVLEHLLCDPPPAPPAAVPALADAVPMGLTLRQHFEAHRSNPSCAGCHKVMDPIGFALENFDASGSYRTTDNGVMVDATGQLADGTPLTGAKSLSEAVASDADFAICVAKQVLTYAVGRSFSAPEAKSYAAGIGVQMKAASWPDFLKSVITSQAFVTRRGEAI